MSWSEIKHAVNSTLGTSGFKPIDKQIGEAIGETIGVTKEIKDILKPNRIYPGTSSSINIINSEKVSTAGLSTIIGNCTFPTTYANKGDMVRINYVASMTSSGWLYLSTLSSANKSVSELNANNVLKLQPNDSVYKTYTDEIEIIAGTTYYLHLLKSAGSGGIKCNMFSLNYSVTVGNNIIKSIQSGKTTATTATIGTVNPDKAIVIPRGLVTGEKTIALDTAGSYTVIEFT